MCVRERGEEKGIDGVDYVCVFVCVCVCAHVLACRVFLRPGEFWVPSSEWFSISWLSHCDDE